jgi:hypothetical protein
MECAYRKQDRDAAKAMMAYIDSSANRVCLQAQNAMQRSDDESEKELECEIWNRRIGQSCREDLGERRGVDEVSWEGGDGCAMWRMRQPLVVHGAA